MSLGRYNPREVLSTPRSLEACRRGGVAPRALSLEGAAEAFAGCTATTPAEIAAKAEFVERRRQALLNIVQSHYDALCREHTAMLSRDCHTPPPPAPIPEQRPAFGSSTDDATVRYFARAQSNFADMVNRAERWQENATRIARQCDVARAHRQEEVARRAEDRKQRIAAVQQRRLELGRRVPSPPSPGTRASTPPRPAAPSHTARASAVKQSAAHQGHLRQEKLQAEQSSREQATVKAHAKLAEQKALRSFVARLHDVDRRDHATRAALRESARAARVAEAVTARSAKLEHTARARVEEHQVRMRRLAQAQTTRHEIDRLVEECAVRSAREVATPAWLPAIPRRPTTPPVARPTKRGVGARAAHDAPFTIGTEPRAGAVACAKWMYQDY